ncbi:MAG TPA: YciI family protein, partial [Mycobacterium sp.]|nr:YciI family protein [Mycobacterium sp.]
SGEQLEPPKTATTVRHQDGDIYVVDGPFIEAKEHIGGFAIVEVATFDEALDLARTWPAGGSVEVRRVVERG